MTNSILKKVKIYLPQIYASLITSLVYMCTSIDIIYSSVLIPQLKNELDTVAMTDMDQMWIVNCISLVIPCTSILVGTAADKLGRLWVLKFTAIPHMIGWTIIALGNSSTMILIGRVITGIALAFQIGPSFVYLSEISSPNVRGGLLTIPGVFFSLGTVLVYFFGYFTSWQIIAWISCAYGGICAALLFMLPNSPSWLVSKNRIDEATKSLEWFNKYQPGNEESIQQFVKSELARIQEEVELNTNRSKSMETSQLVCFPTVYKPCIILIAVLFFQQFGGVNVVLMNAIMFLNEAGITYNAYLTSTYMALTRLLMTIVCVWLMNRFGRRHLLIGSFCAMGFSMTISGLYSNWIHEGVKTNTWVPLLALLIYFVATTGAVIVPFALSGELFPLHVRGVASNVSLGCLFAFSFISVSSYPFLLSALNGVHNLQYLYSFSSFAAALVTFLFIPETLNKRLFEIEEYFWTHTFAIKMCSRKKNYADDTEKN